MNTKALATAVLAGGLALTLSACGSSGSPAASGTANNNQYGDGSGFGGARFGGGGTSGLVAAVTGSTAQVQSTSAQTAVSWTASTTFSDEVKTTKAAVKVGECVQAARAQTSSSSSSSSASMSAATVRIMTTAGGCPTIRQGLRPGGAPTNAPAGPNGARPRNFRSLATIGVVTSVSASGFVVKPTAFGGTSSSAVTVTTTAATTYLQTRKATASAVKVGVCLAANGTADSTGAVKATRITVSQPTNGVCTQIRFGGFPGGGPVGPGAGQNG